MIFPAAGGKNWVWGFFTKIPPCFSTSGLIHVINPPLVMKSGSNKGGVYDTVLGPRFPVTWRMIPKKIARLRRAKKMKVLKHFPFRNRTFMSPKCPKFRACGGLIHRLQTDPNDAMSLNLPENPDLTRSTSTNKGGGL